MYVGGCPPLPGKEANPPALISTPGPTLLREFDSSGLSSSLEPHVRCLKSLYLSVVYLLQPRHPASYAGPMPRTHIHTDTVTHACTHTGNHMPNVSSEFSPNSARSTVTLGASARTRTPNHSCCCCGVCAPQRHTSSSLQLLQPGVVSRWHRPLSGFTSPPPGILRVGGWVAATRPPPGGCGLENDAKLPPAHSFKTKSSAETK